MLDLIIQIKDGKPYEHPILLDNFKQAFPDIDINNLPNTYAWFKRIPRPKLKPYEKGFNTTYEIVDDICQDVWYPIPMTPEEKLQTQNEVKHLWSLFNRPSWTFNEETCQFDPPIPYPTDGKQYTWNEEQLNWILADVINSEE
jgi:hypothetical protein